MSDHRVIEQLSLHLQGLLFEGLSGAGDVAEDFTAPANISLDSPAEILDDDNGGGLPVLLSLYLYQVIPNGHLKNQPLIRAGAGEQRYPPLMLDLYYLLTPLAGTPTDDLAILGRAMQILEAHPTVRAAFLDSELRPRSPELRLGINPVSLEELTRIWNAFNQPYQLSVCYKAQFVAIDSARQPQTGAPVVEGVFDVHQAAVGEGAA